MNNQITFKIKNELFSVLSLIDKNINDDEIIRFIETTIKLDGKCNIEQPRTEDISAPHDNWLCYYSDKLGITFEFIENTLCYITFDKNWKKIIKMDNLKDDKLIIGIIQNEQGQTNYISFASKSLIIDKGLYPNRLSFITMSFFDSPVIM